ncbi:MAG: hypothetical protein ACLU9Q_07235 [Marvinbryantia sp.]|uniref:hypothetical protein n=1 Tax=Marvinbryantia sp. TaxID=2496532 RepID=UPI002803EA6C|nr:hypothetical protein [uncultured Marvinbryantia sp.]
MKNGQPADNTLHKRCEKYEQILKNLTIMSDMFMRNIFKKAECTEYVLQVIMKKRLNGLMDMNILNPGQDFDKLPESYVIFITVRDSLGYDLSIYHIDREIRENSRDFPDGSHIVYVNSSKQENTELGKLMHDFHCKNADEMYSQVLARKGT